MRRGNYHGANKIPVITGDDGQFIGFGLGADYTAEHEWGIDKLRTAFGMDSSQLTFGLARRAGKPGAPGIEGLIYFEFTEKKVKQAIMAYDGYFRFTEPDRRKEELRKNPELSLRTWFSRSELSVGEDKKPQVVGAWSDSDFGIHVSGAENIANLKKLYEAAIKGDICFFMGGGMAAFDNPGLCVGIASAVPESVRKLWYDADEDYHKLKQTAAATGIEDYLRKNDKRWYALSPRWANEAKTEVEFWLNPAEQHKYNAMWCTVEDLRQWADDTGPVMMKPNEVSK